jgi:hypothetical protein
MLIDAIIGIFVTIANLFFLTFNIIFDFTGLVIPLPESGVGYIFGNIMHLNDILPISEMFVIALAAIAWKTAIFSYDIFLFTIMWLGKFKTIFITWR